jgi:uroporphyrinogen-III synthase
MPALALTRPQGVEPTLAGAFTQAGWTVLDCALTSLTPASAPALADAQAQFARANAVVLVSPQAVSAALAHTKAAMQDKLVAVMGPGSRAALLAGGIAPEQIVQSATQDGLGLVPVLLQRLPAQSKIAIGRAQTGRDDLAQALRAQGLHVNFATLYLRHTIAWPALLYAQLEKTAPGDLHILLTTSSAPGEFMARLDAYNTAMAAAIRQRSHAHCTHANVAQAARDAGFACVFTHTASGQALVASLQSRHVA